MNAVEIRVHGRVQGVGFRYYACREAARVGVTGWVRNEPDGTVLVHAEGSPDQLRQMEDFLRRGPSYARVDSVDIRRPPATGTFRSFNVEY
ncbi:MAG: acylphosphatase [Spirochaetaceae bacterium]|nr:MAG: acylphosphatase [Spirochaetaceae bacterium]